MRVRTRERSIAVAQYFIATPMATISSAAKIFNISRSTIYKDLTQRLEEYPLLHEVVKDKLQKNKHMKRKRK